MNRPTVCLSGLLAAAMLVVLPGCLSVKSLSDADPYVLHHHNWWNYYQRGRLYLRDGQIHEARTDFETALGRRPGARYSYTQERWRARTYGMHMLEGYFPHRELGVCLFELNELSEALNLLEASMKMAPSARAKFYINRIQENLAMEAAPPPRITTADLPTWTNLRTISLQGTVYGSNLVANLMINGEPEFIELATPRLEFRRELPLKEGRNQIEIIAEDVSGKQTTANLVLMADWTPPEIHFHRNGSKLNISWKDNLRLHHLQMNDQALTPDGNEYTIDFTPALNEPLRLVASDCADNQLEWTLSEKELRHLAQPLEAAPPQLHLADAGKTITLYNSEYALDIRAEDDTALKNVVLNGKNLLSDPSPLFRTLRHTSLIPGTNHLALAVEDFDGNRIEEQITVVYRKPEYLDRIYRLAAALSPLSGEISDPTFKRRVSHLIGQELTLEPVRFYLLATEEETRAIHNEKTLSTSELVDERVMLKRGKQLDADLVFITKVLNDAPGQTIYTQVLDINSGEELFIEDVYLEDPQQLPREIDGLVMKIEQRFPIIQASVREQKKQLAINAGEQNGVYKGMRLLIIRSDGSFEQGRVLQAEDRPAELIVSRVASDTASVVGSQSRTKNLVKSGDFVFSR